LVQHLDLLGDHDWVPRVCGHDRRAEKDLVSLHGGAGEQGEGVEAGASGGQPGRLHPRAFCASHEIKRRFSVWGSRMYAYAFVGHGENLGKELCPSYHRGAVL
jgi:hypothetical protein